MFLCLLTLSAAVDLYAAMNSAVNSSTDPVASSASVGESEFLKEETLHAGNWLCLKNFTYKDPNGIERIWEVATRSAARNSDFDCVVIIPILRRPLRADCLVCVKQYRPPVKKYCLEFPAGFIDGNETVEEAAKRELKEETGYVATAVIQVSAPTATNPGSEDSTMAIVTVEIDGDDPINSHPKQQLEETEFIEVVLIPVRDFMENVNEMSAKGVIVDSRVYSYGLALQMSKANSAKEECWDPLMDK